MSASGTSANLTLWVCGRCIHWKALSPSSLVQLQYTWLEPIVLYSDVWSHCKEKEATLSLQTKLPSPPQLLPSANNAWVGSAVSALLAAWCWWRALTCSSEITRQDHDTSFCSYARSLCESVGLAWPSGPRVDAPSFDTDHSCDKIVPPQAPRDEDHVGPVAVLTCRTPSEAAMMARDEARGVAERETSSRHASDRVEAMVQFQALLDDRAHHLRAQWAMLATAP